MDVREQVVRGLLVPVDGTKHESADRPLGRARLVVAHRSMVPCGRPVRRIVLLVVHRSVMSRCAGTHPLRPPLPLDRLVPERLHTLKDAASAPKRAAPVRWAALRAAVRRVLAERTRCRRPTVTDTGWP
ncbi:hypothetical protein Shyhy01_57600 [Streptomyces hygroscopicus subsp. hygroscopicus]|nr:hypothetical protein Shyhy01_57600 [Streptomyces hygroscopicus subsp. hygroscopicus]